MPRLVSFVAAEGVAIDQLTARVTAFNMIDHVMVGRLPARVVRISAISLYELGSAHESFRERVRFVSPSGAVAASSESDVTLTIREADHLPNSHRSIHVLWSATLDVVGDYHLVLDRREVEEEAEEGSWTEMASLCITVLLQAHPILNAQSPSISVPAIPPPAEASQPPSE